MLNIRQVFNLILGLLLVSFLSSCASSPKEEVSSEDPKVNLDAEEKQELKEKRAGRYTSWDSP